MFSRIEKTNETAARVGRNVEHLRTERELTLKALSSLLGKAGCRLSLGQLSKIENGDRNVSVEELEALAVAFDVPVGRLLAQHHSETKARAAELKAALEAGEQRRNEAGLRWAEAQNAFEQADGDYEALRAAVAREAKADVHLRLMLREWLKNDELVAKASARSRAIAHRKGART